MNAFHNDPSIKRFYLDRVHASRAADDIVRGTYGKSVNSHWRGCAVGCTLHDSNGNHAAYETELGVPRILARLEDGIFESLPIERSKSWPEEFLSAIPVGADLSMVWPRFAVWLLGDPADGVIRFAKTKNQRAAIQRVVELYQRKASGETIELDDWKNAGDAAGAADAYAAAYAAYAYADDADAYAADAYAAAAYAADAADDAADDAPDADTYARSSARVKQADKLLELMTSAPVPEAIAV